MEGVSLSARNCVYLTCQHKGAKHLLHIPLYPTTAIFRQSQTYATTIAKSQAMEYFKSIHHICIVFVCICVEMQYLQTRS